MARGRATGLRVLVVSRNFPRSGAPWLGTYVAEQVKELSRRADVRVVSPVSLTPPVSELRGWLRELRRVKAWARSLRTSGSSAFVLYPRWFSLPKKPFEATEGLLLASVVVKEILGLRRHGWRPDVLHGHFVYPDGFATVLAGRLLGLPAVVTAHGSDLKFLPRKGRSLEAQAKWTLRRARAVICVSPELRGLALQLAAAPLRTYVVPNGYDPTAFRRMSRAAARRALGLDDDARVLLYAGNLYPVKGPDLLLEAYSRLNGWRDRTRLVLVGDGFLRTGLEARARDLGLGERVRFVGPRPHAEMPRWFAAADVVVLPSRSEGWPTVVVEALASGRPVVAARVGAVPEIVRDGRSGFVVEPEQVASLSRALVAALEREWDEDEIARSAPLLSWSDVADRIASIYQEIETK